MTLDIVFGWHLDGFSYPETSTGERFDIGGLILGTAGFAQQLALRLGIVSPIGPQAVRIANYMSALKACDDHNQFYSGSFSVDPWSTASCLLVMRDQLISAGWDGSQIKDCSPKLHSLSRTEEATQQIGSPAETVRAILYKMRGAQIRNISIGSIKLVTPLGLLPTVWQEILNQLAQAGVKIDQISAPTSLSQDTDLGKLQAFLRDGKHVKLKNDGSFCLLEADDEYQLGEVTAAWLGSREMDLEGLVALRNSPTPIIDAFCNRHGLPRLGGHNKSRWRTALQVLPLILETCWLPANPYRTLELIALPQGPVRKGISHHFVKALREEPGFGGDRWAKAWTDAKEYLQSDLSAKFEDLDEIAKRISREVQNLKFWLEPKRHDPEKGMPIEQAIEICRHVGRWASGKASDDGREMFLHASNAAQELEQTLVSSGLEKINKIQLDRILDAVSGEGCMPEQWEAQEASWSIVDHPGQIWGAAQTLLWWGFTQKSLSEFQFAPWTPSELAILANSGVHLDLPAVAVRREAFSWKQAILHVQKDVLLCRPRVENGLESSLHPLWHELKDIVSASEKSVITQAHSVLSLPQGQVGKNILQLHEVLETNPPKASRNWSAPKGAITARPEESASSVRDLLACPMAWVLRYHAQLFPSILLTLPDGDQLVGDIGHKLFRRMFSNEKAIGANLVTEAGAIFDELIESVGLPLLLPGRETEKQHARNRLMEAVKDFSEFLTAGELQVVACETHKERNFGEGLFSGDIDILLKDRAGRSVVVDYKWNKEIKYKIAEIENSQHLQLAAYAWLESIESGSFAQVGYYMLRQRRLIHCGDGVLSVGQQVPSVPLPELWQKVETSYQTVIAALTEGSICATGIAEEATTAVATIQPLTFDPPCKFCDKGNICGVKGLDDA